MLNKVIIILCLPLSSLWAASPSLFFTQQEIQLIHSANKKTAEKEEVLNLSAIIYLDQNHWSFWLNNKLIRPQQPLNIKGLHLDHVTPQKVLFSWHFPASSKVLKFTLRPNQTIVLKEGKADSHEISQN